MRFVRISTVAVAAAFYAVSAHAGQHGQAPVHPVPHQNTAPHAPVDHDDQAHAPTTHAPTTHASHTTTTTNSPIAARIESHPQLASRLTALLPFGMTLQQAASGFRNQGQFIAALHVSHNLGIPFSSLKTQMVTDHLSLGQAIQKLKPQANATTETEKAETEADNDVKTGGTTSTTSGTSSTTGTSDHDTTHGKKTHR